MTKKTASGSGRTPLSLFYRSPRLMLGLSLLSGFSILSSGLVIAQTDSSADTGAAPLSTNVEAVPKLAPEPPAQRKQVVTTIVVPVTPAPRANREHEAPALSPAPVADKKPVVPSQRTSETATRKPTRVQRTSEGATRKPTRVQRTSETANRKPARVQRTSETANYKPDSSQRTAQTANRKPATLQRSAAALGPAISVSNKPILAAPDLSVSNSETVAKPPKVYLNPDRSPESAKAPDSPANPAIERADSSTSTTRKDDELAPVILTDRSTGCRTVSKNGQLVSGICDVTIPTQEVATPRTVVREVAKTQAVNSDSASQSTVSQPSDNSRLVVRQPQLSRIAAQASRLGKVTIAESRLDRVMLQDSQLVEATSRDAQLAGATTQEPQLIGVRRLPTASVASTEPIKHNPARLQLRGISRSRQRANTAYSPQLQPVAALPTSSLPISEGWTSPTGLAYYNVTARPQGRPNSSNANFVFPLASPSAISSLFGWRIHPITGDYRFHAGTDISAPEGTPVLAAVAGQVITADFMGGYGLTVVVQHEDGNNVSLYAHLSEIFVQPGEFVEQGNALGRVGSTGFSTGPHLHFEWRHMTPDGWVALDAKPNIEYALAQFVKSLEVAQTPPQPEPVSQQPASQAPISQQPASQTPISQQPTSQPPALQPPIWQQSVSQQPVSQRGL